MAETYMFQVAPNLPPQKFSDRPVKIDGVKIQPRWAWSEDYKKWVQQSIKGNYMGRYYKSIADERMRYRANAYAEWWVANHWGEHGPVDLAYVGEDIVTKLAAYQEGKAPCPCKGVPACPHSKAEIDPPSKWDTHGEAINALADTLKEAYAP